MKTRVLVIGMSDVVGGVEREVMSIISRCKDTVFDFLCYGSDFSYENDLPDSRFFYLPRRRSNYLESQKKLKEFFVLHGNDYDCIWINTSSASNLSAHRMAKRYSRAAVITHSHNSKVDHDVKLLKAVHSCFHYINRKALVRLTDVHVACSKSAATHLYGGASKDAVIIYNGIDSDRFAFDPVVRRIKRDQLGITDDSMVFIIFGRLERVKNVSYAIDVFDAYNRYAERTDNRLLIVGDGSERKNLESHVREKKIRGVSFIGFQNDVKPYLDASDVVLQPSFFEGFPVSTVEAQANGLRCLLSDRITREAAVTDLVSFHGIGADDITEWVDAISGADLNYDRSRYRQAVQDEGMDIDSVASSMERLFAKRGDR